MNVKLTAVFFLTLVSIGGWWLPVQAQESSHTVAYDHIQFTYPASLATGLQIETVEGVPYSENILFAETYPEHVRFSFPGYLGGSQFRLPYPFAAPQILVYATESMQEFGYEYQDQLNVLESLLQERPDLSNYVGASVRPPEIHLPFLPWINSAQVLRSHPQYVEIAGVGSGIRYVTYYSQESAPICDQEIFYTFQGIVAGGNYYVSAILPVKTGVLPEEIDTTGIDWDAFGASYSDIYLPKIFAQINQLPDEAFTPPLSVLDMLIQSITIEGQAAGWQTYTDVRAGYSFQFPVDHQMCLLDDVLEFIPGEQAYDNPDQDQCALSYQAQPIKVISSPNDDVFQAFRLENHPDAFTDYQEEAFLIDDRPTVRISGQEVETGLHFQLVRIEQHDAYLIFRALTDVNIAILNQMVDSLRFLPEPSADNSG
jgi:hypothetical protein